MRAYKFLSEQFGLKSLYEKRLKVSRVLELNDPFEARPYNLTDTCIRKTFLTTREDLDKEKGLICFSRDWHNPVIWAHYGDGQKGLCLGFDIPDATPDPDGEVMSVTYEPTPLKFPPNFADLPGKDRFGIVRKIISTKFAGWTYEGEIRMWEPLKNEEGGLYFLDFDERLRIAEVIVGARCTLGKCAIARALGPLASDVTVIKAREDDSLFQMVEDKEFE